MAAWVLGRALEARNHLDAERRTELDESLGLSAEDLAAWDEIGRKLMVPFHEGVISQFEGYERLLEFEWEAYRERYGDIRRLDRILEAEGDTVNRYKASKQADVLMLFYLFSSEELEQLFSRLGFSFESEMIPRTVDYYLRRTSNGSTLSGIVHSWVLARSNRAESWMQLKEALESDIADVQGGTTPEGIHLGAMAGTVDLIQRGQTGLEIRDDMLRLDPCLPHELQGLSFRIRHRGQWLDVEIEGGRISVSASESWNGPSRLVIGDRSYPLSAGEVRQVACHYPRRGAGPVEGG